MILYVAYKNYKKNEQVLPEYNIQDTSNGTNELNTEKTKAIDTNEEKKQQVENKVSTENNHESIVWPSYIEN